jgi:hypothetical protein
MTHTHRARHPARRTRALALVSTGILVGTLPATTAIAHESRDPHHGDRSSVKTVVDGLNGPRGIAAVGHGRLIVTQTDGTFSLVVSREGHHRRHAETKVIKLGKVSTMFAPAVDVGPDGTVWLLTGGGDPKDKNAATLFRWRWGDKAPKAFANIGAYQKTDPDPYDLEKNPTDSNPFGVAALADGSVLVADAGGNDLLRVDSYGKISTVARLKPRVVAVPTGLPKTLPSEEPGGKPTKIPPAGTKIPAEAVATSVTVGADGYWYVGELRGFPGTPGTSEIWRIKPGTQNATCDPNQPWKGDCKRFADGLTSIMDLAAGDHGQIYAVEMSKQSWLKAELKLPGSQVGALIEVSDWGKRQREIAPGAFNLPGGVATGDRGEVYVAGPVFGPGSVQRVDSFDHHRSGDHQRSSH